MRRPIPDAPHNVGRAAFAAQLLAGKASQVVVLALSLSMHLVRQLRVMARLRHGWSPPKAFEWPKASGYAQAFAARRATSGLLKRWLDVFDQGGSLHDKPRGSRGSEPEMKSPAAKEWTKRLVSYFRS